LRQSGYRVAHVNAYPFTNESCPILRETFGSWLLFNFELGVKVAMDQANLNDVVPGSSARLLPTRHAEASRC
jgi:hypothetical protein